MNPLSRATSGRTALNPNAREFVPTTMMRSSSRSTNVNTADEHEPSSTASENGKAFSDKTGTSDTCTSDEESRRYWEVQLPDDILTPDDDFFMPAAQDEVSPLRPPSSEPLSPAAALKDLIDVFDNILWPRTVLNGKQTQGIASISAHELSNVEDELALPSSQLSSLGGSWNAPNNLTTLSQHVLKEHINVDGLSLLASDLQSQSLANVYQADGGELDRALHMLSQLKLQDDKNSWHSLPSPSHFSPSSRSSHSSVLSTPDLLGGSHHIVGEFDMQEPSGDFSLVPSSLTSISPYASFRHGDVPIFNDERFDTVLLRQKQGLPLRSWMESDDALVNLILELREEARHHARIRNFYAEQARQATYAGNRIHAKEATAKGQFHNRLMKVAQTKAAEMEIQRNMSAMCVPSFGPGQTQLVDLRGFHVNEALNILRRELSAFWMAARSSRQRQQVLISVGTGYGRGARAPARLLFAVKRHLVEEELLSFTEPQPGVLKVVVG